MKLKYILMCSALSACLLFSAITKAELILDNKAVGLTENAVMLSDGRYFVAGSKGIFEVKRTPDVSDNCNYEPISGLTYCIQVPQRSDFGNCFFAGMTTDDTYLYATCNERSLITGSIIPQKAALFRVLPGISEADEITIRPYEVPNWYNGMIMLDDSTMLMSASQSGSLLNFAGADIVKLTITDHQQFDFVIEDWLTAERGNLMPNGLARDDHYLYFITGQRLQKVTLDMNYQPGEIETLYQAPFYKVLDDMTIFDNTLAIAEIGAINGVGKNVITLIDLNNPKQIEKISTDKIQLSSLVVDSGSLFNAGEFIGTSFFQGGLHRFSGNPTPEVTSVD